MYVITSVKGTNIAPLVDVAHVPVPIPELLRRHSISPERLRPIALHHPSGDSAGHGVVSGEASRSRRRSVCPGTGLSSSGPPRRRDRGRAETRNKL